MFFYYLKKPLFEVKNNYRKLLTCSVLKTSDDLEIYEVDQASKDKLEEICDIRQPVLFDFENQQIMETSNKDYISQVFKRTSLSNL